MANPPSQPNHTDNRGHVLIAHPEDESLQCVLGCTPLTDGIRHHPDCPKVAAWREALNTVKD